MQNVIAQQEAELIQLRQINGSEHSSNSGHPRANGIQKGHRGSSPRYTMSGRYVVQQTYLPIHMYLSYTEYDGYQRTATPCKTIQVCQWTAHVAPIGLNPTLIVL